MIKRGSWASVAKPIPAQYVKHTLVESWVISAAQASMKEFVTHR